MPTIEFKITNNIISDSDREGWIIELAPALYGLGFYPFEADTIGLGYFEIGDRLIVKDPSGNPFEVVVMEHEIEVTQGITEFIKCEIPAGNSTNYDTAGIIGQKITNTEIKVDKQNGEIILSVYFHNPSKKLFENSVKWFLKRGYTFLSVNELLIIKENKLPFPPMAVIFTVDDGWKNNKNNIFSVAEKYKIPVTTFISTQPVETGELYWWTYVDIALKNKWEVPSVSAMKQLENDQRLKIVNELKLKIKSDREALFPEDLIGYQNSKFINFGAHTVTHPILSKCDRETSYFEITASQKKLESWLKYSINSFAYPNGNYTEREIEILKQSI